MKPQGRNCAGETVNPYEKPVRLDDPEDMNPGEEETADPAVINGTSCLPPKSFDPSLTKGAEEKSRD